MSNPRPDLVPPSNRLPGPALVANHSRPRPATPTPRGNPELRGGGGRNHRINPAQLRAARRSARWIRRPRASLHGTTSSSRKHLSSSPRSDGETEARPRPPGPHSLRFAPPGIPRCSHLEGSPARLRGARLWGEGRVKGGGGGKGGGDAAAARRASCTRRKANNSAAPTGEESALGATCQNTSSKVVKLIQRRVREPARAGLGPDPKELMSHSMID